MNLRGNRRTFMAREFPQYRKRYDGHDFQPGSETHERIVNNLLMYAEQSYNNLSGRFQTMRKIDENLTSYIPLNTAEQIVKNSDSRKPIQIVIPMTFATLETILSYYIQYLDLPLFRYTTTGDPDDTVGIILLERHVEWQSRKFRHPLYQLHAVRDALAYGFSSLVPRWEVKNGIKRVTVPIGSADGLPENIKVPQPYVQYEGNRLYNPDPYKTLLDPNCNITDFQDSRFFGWYEKKDLMSYIEQEDVNPFLFNFKYFDGQSGISALFTDRSGRSRDTNSATGANLASYKLSQPIDVAWFVVNLIPSSERWGLGSGRQPEKWLFGLAGDSVLVAATPLNLDHGDIPATVLAPFYDGHSSSPFPFLETTYGMQQAIDYHYNSRLNFLRKVNGMMWLVDPSLVNLPDLEDTRDGMIARLLPDAWGRGLMKDALMPIPVQDYTAGAMNDIGFLMGMSDRVTGAGAPTNSQRVHGSTERVTATEMNLMSSGSMSKFGRIAFSTFWQSTYPLGNMIASQTMQFANEEIWAMVNGRGESDLRRLYGQQSTIPISPYNMRMGEVVVHDGGANVNGDPNAWPTMMQTATAIPELYQAFDVTRIFSQWLRLQGIRNVEDFKRAGGLPPVQATVVPDEQAGNMAADGQLVPSGSLQYV